MSISATQGHRARNVPTPRSAVLAASVWLRRASLDERLKNGADASSAPEIASRARHLTAPRCRRKLATGLNRVLRAAVEPPRPLSSVIPVRRREVEAAHRDIEQLINDLLSSSEVQPRGVLLVRDLLTHGDSPFFDPSAPDELDRAIRHARAALHLG
jgi:hypothetical protein